jgi:hypothetical protein
MSADVPAGVWDPILKERYEECEFYVTGSNFLKAFTVLLFKHLSTWLHMVTVPSGLNCILATHCCRPWNT